MSGVNVSNRVLLQDESGRFMADVNGKASAAVWELTRYMAAIAVANAPMKTGELRQSIEGFMTGPMEGVVTATAPHAVVQEVGGAPHQIGAPGQTLSKNPQSHPATQSTESFGPVKGPVNHPGNPATRYLAKAFRVTREIAPDVFARFLGS